MNKNNFEHSNNRFQNGRHQAVHGVPQGREGPGEPSDQVVRLPLEQQAVHGRGVGPRNVAGQVEGRNCHTRSPGNLNFEDFI